MKQFNNLNFEGKIKYVKWFFIVFFIIMIFFLVFVSGEKVFNITFLTDKGNKLVLCFLLILVVNIVINVGFSQIKSWFSMLKLNVEKTEQLEYENKKIKEQIEQIKNLYEERDTEHKIILKMIMLILQSVELKKVLNVSLEILCNFLHYDRALVYLYDRTKNVLECISSYNVTLQDQSISSIDLNKQNNFITKTVVKRKPFIAGVIQDFNVVFGVFDAISHPDVIASVPLEAKDKVVGVLVVDNAKTKRRITQKDLRKLVQFTDIIGLAMENARLYETEKNFSEQLNIKLNEAVEQLKKAQQQTIQAETLAALGRMSTIISHEIRNMLTSIRNSAEALLASIKDEPNKKYVDYI
ncbi:MAG: GAF domain-containing protein, partial [Endomicrobia bacterium]|nr:GAF domain-containing protein [Endomicrobiia bacterium]